MKKVIVLFLSIISGCLTVRAQVEIKLRGDIYLDTESSSKLGYVDRANKIGVSFNKRIGINKAIHTGLYYSQTIFNIKDNENDLQTYVRDYTGYDGLVDSYNPNFLTDQLKTSYEYNNRINFSYITVPVGASYYFFPRLYLDYELGFSFLVNKPSLRYATDDQESPTYWKIPLQYDAQKAMTIGHTATVNAAGIFKMIDFGVGLNIGGGSFIKDLPFTYDFMDQLKVMTSQRTTLIASIQINLIQIKKKRL